jgi:hypothetical protein
MPRGTGGRPKRVSLFDWKQPLVARFRYAKSVSKDTFWWLETLASLDSSLNRLAWNLAFWSYAPVSIAIENSDAVAKSLDELTDDEWSFLLRFLVVQFRLNTYYRIPRRTPKGNAKVKSSRLAYLIASTDHETYGEQLFLSNLIDAKEKFPGLSEFRQFWAVRTALAGELDWKAALGVIRATYKDGEGYGVSMALAASSQQMPGVPVVVADQILAGSKDYPCALVDAALTVVSSSVKKEIRPVGQIARRDRWFAN